jgi:hypothetical protein
MLLFTPPTTLKELVKADANNIESIIAIKNKNSQTYFGHVKFRCEKRKACGQMCQPRAPCVFHTALLGM